jgi:hypothetical protein
MLERELVIRLRLPRTPRARWTLAAIAAVLCGGAIVYATVPNSFKPGDPLSSTAVNANFTNLDGRVTTLETTDLSHFTTTPSGDWVNYAGSTDSLFGYFKDPGGVVHLKGIINETTANSHQVITTLPAGYLPSRTLVFGITCATSPSAVAPGLLYISSTGPVSTDSSCNTGYFVILEGVSFRAEK